MISTIEIVYMFQRIIQQGFNSLTHTPSEGFATKSLKLIKGRMKAVLSIKKITKVVHN